ncbi:MAG: HK97 family phage prohead protease [Xanthomonadales bacterium]|nr:HK97 family phage prohead protease [Xanthomonadales bacterium]
MGDVATLIAASDSAGHVVRIVSRMTNGTKRPPPKRTIHAVDLREVTITASPAYEDTECGRSLREGQGRQREKRAKLNARQKRRATTISAWKAEQD